MAWDPQKINSFIGNAELMRDFMIKTRSEIRLLKGLLSVEKKQD